MQGLVMVRGRGGGGGKETTPKSAHLVSSGMSLSNREMIPLLPTDPLPNHISHAPLYGVSQMRKLRQVQTDETAGE